MQSSIVTKPSKGPKQEIFVGEFIHYCTIQACTGGVYLQINEPNIIVPHINHLIFKLAVIYLQLPKTTTTI